MPLLILVGPPGALVNQCAEELSLMTSWPYAGVDAAVAEAGGKPLERIATEEGSGKLRRLEAAVASALLESVQAEDHKILALGSGSLGDSTDDVDFADIRVEVERLRGEGATVVHLTGDLATLVKRTGLAGPRLAAVDSPRKIFYHHMARRLPLYASIASATVDTSGKDVAQVAREVAGLVCGCPVS